jgi:hypothetical protein
VRAGGGAAFTVKYFNLFHCVPTVDRISVESLALLARVDVNFLWFFVVIWCAAEFHCHFPIQFIIGLITCINDDNEGLNAINLMHQNILFTNWQHFVFSINVF